MRRFAEQIVAALRESPSGLTDVELARLFDKHQAHVHTTCERLAARNLIVRDKSVRPLRNYIAGSADGLQARHPPDAPLSGQLAARDEWFWEGNVQAALIAHLAATGWRVLRAADTASKERGVDVLAERGGQELLVEVKGWPSRAYADPSRAGEAKPTPPSVQATVWFDAAVVAALRLRDQHPEKEVAACFPDVPRYRNLWLSVEASMARCRVGVFAVREDGLVTTWP